MQAGSTIHDLSTPPSTQAELAIRPLCLQGSLSTLLPLGARHGLELPTYLSLPPVYVPRKGHKELCLIISAPRAPGPAPGPEQGLRLEC